MTDGGPRRDQLADWIEVLLTIRGERVLGIDALQGYLNKQFGVPPTQLSLALDEMSRRASLLGNLYPFRIFDDLAVSGTTTGPVTPYLTLNLLSSGSLARQNNNKPTAEMAIIFEDLVVAASTGFFGPGGGAVRFGWPSEDGRPQDFGQAISWLCHKLGVAEGPGFRRPTRKDGGVDVVAWRHFPDGRPGFPIMLIQCTLQGNLTEKSLDIDTRIWGSWLQMLVDPTTVLATPQAVGSGVLWDELTVRNLLLERIRIAGLITVESRAERRTTWAASKLNELRDEYEELIEL